MSFFPTQVASGPVGKGISSTLESLGVGPETAGTIGADFLPAVGTTLGAYSIGKDLLAGKKMGTLGGAAKGAGVGASVGSMFPGVGTLLGAGIGGVAGGILGQFGHGPKYYEGKRREALVQGLSGQALKNGTFNTTRGAIALDPHAFNVDMTHPNANLAISLMNPASFILTGGHERKMSTDLTGILANAVNDPDQRNVIKNALSFYETLGLKPDDMISKLTALSQHGDVTPEELSVYTNTINGLREGGHIPVPGPTPPQSPAAKIFSESSPVSKLPLTTSAQSLIAPSPVKPVSRPAQPMYSPATGYARHV